MKRSKSIYRLALPAVVVLVLAVFFTGCRKWSHNGDIDGQWQVLEVTYSGVPVDFPEGEIYYYNFYLHTFQLTFTGVRPNRLTGNFTYDKEDDKLGLELGYVIENKVDPLWMQRLVYWGIPSSGVVVMKIHELSSSRLVMGYDNVMIVCRKF